MQLRPKLNEKEEKDAIDDVADLVIWGAGKQEINLLDDDDYVRIV